MEKALDKVVHEALGSPGVVGVVVADHQGLCLSAGGAAHVDSAGIVVAISDAACRLQPNFPPPVVCLETDKGKCLIRRHGTLTAAVFKQVQS